MHVCTYAHRNRTERYNTCIIYEYSYIIKPATAHTIGEGERRRDKGETEREKNEEQYNLPKNVD